MLHAMTHAAVSYKAIVYADLADAAVAHAAISCGSIFIDVQQSYTQFRVALALAVLAYANVA